MKYKVVYTDILPEWVGGRCEYPNLPLGECTIKIRPKYKLDYGLLEHELEHWRQWKKGNVLHVLMYKFVQSYRYRCELEAYNKQLKVYGYTTVNQVQWIVDALDEKYNLNTEREKIHQDVMEMVFSNK